MVIKTASALAIAACLGAIASLPVAYAQTAPPTVVVKHRPIVNRGDTSASQSPRQNVIESKQYEQLLRTNPAFRKARMQKECGSINDPQLHQSCLASFNQ